MSALIIKSGRILSTGYNRIQNHPAAYFACSFHAEYDALRKAPNSISGAKMYVYRFSREDSSLKVSKPCVICQHKISESKLGSVVFIDEYNTICRQNFNTISKLGYCTKHHYTNSVNY